MENESRVKIKLHPKQEAAFTSQATEIGYGGAAGGGKSFFLRAMAIFACSQIPNFTAFLFRKHYDELISNHVDGAGGFREILAPWVDSGKCKIVEDQVRFWNGSKIRLCHISQNKDLEKFLGPEIPLLLIDQAEQFPERWIRFLRARCRIPNKEERLPEPYRKLFPRAVYSFNPGGISSPYWRKQFVKAAKPFEVWKTDSTEGGFYRQFIPAYLKDNPSLSEEEYTQALQGLNDEQLVRSLLEGDFDALVGSFFTQYDERRHVIPDFEPPKHWFKYRTFDWGGSDPFAVYWWAVSDGEFFEREIELPDKTRRLVKLWYPRGSLICYREWYGCNPQKASQGLELRNEVVAKGIIERTKETTCGLTFTDIYPFADRGYTKNNLKYTIADDFMDNGCPLTLGNTQRVYGWKQLRDRLIGKDGYPLIYFMNSCIYARDYLPAIPRDDKNPEDAIDSGETTHAPDAIRLACTVRPLVQDETKTVEPKLESSKVSITPLEILDKLKRQQQNNGGYYR